LVFGFVPAGGRSHQLSNMIRHPWCQFRHRPEIL
jgi:hypothetical protein